MIEQADIQQHPDHLMSGESNVYRLITQQAFRTPHKVAIKFGSSHVTYTELTEKANQLAGLLIANNIKPGDKVGLMTNRSIEMVIALLAIMTAGAAYLPLDPGFPADRLDFMLADSEAKLLITAQKHQTYLQSSTARLLIEDAWPQLDNYAKNTPQVNVSDHDLAYILYTSGTTGKPKGVQVEHHSLTNLLLSTQKEPGLSADDTLLAIATISFDIAGLELFLPLISGATMILADNDMAKDGRLLLDTVLKEKVTVLQATPYTWRMLLASGWDEKLPLKVITGGEALPKDLADKLLTRCASLWNYYGPTETTIYSTGKQILATDQLITIGKPIDNTQVYILDEESKHLPDGHEGEICIGGVGVTRGYLNRPELMIEKFIDNPFDNQPGKKLYRTGDLGKILADGEIQYLGRIDQQVKLRGYRIETEEIVYNLVQQPSIQSAVVIVHEDNLGNQHLIAYIVTELPDIKDQTRDWTNALKTKLPEYMVPTDYIKLASIPLTLNGKIDRKQLPEPELFVTTSEHKAASSDTEKMLVQIWSKYFGKDELGIYDNFFELGGHSLIAVQIMAGIGKITGKRLPIATLFKYPTIEKLALLLDSGEEDTTWRSLVPIKPTGTKMPVYIVHGVGLNVLIFHNIASHVDAEQPLYGLQSRGLNGIDEPPDSIETIAAYYNQEILEQNPDGPYAIAGYSLGGYTAIEMARQLQNMGKEVKVLAMFDANFKYFNAQSSLPKQFLEVVQRQMRKTAFVITSLVKQPLNTVSYLTYMVKTRILKKLGLFEEPEPEGIPEYMQEIVTKLQYAVSRYKMTPYNGSIQLFKSTIRDYYADDPKYLGWKKYALKGIEIHQVPGDHLNMLLPPNDKEFAKILQTLLNQYN